MRKILLTLGAIGAFAALPGAASAQVTVGPYLAFHDDYDFGVGGFVGIPLADIHEDLAFLGDFGYYFPGDNGYDVDYWELNANATFRFPLESPTFTPWVLGGLNIANWSRGDGHGDSEGSPDSDTDIGLNVGGGLSFMRGPAQPFVGVKFELGGGHGAVLFGGVSFDLQLAGQ